MVTVNLDGCKVEIVPPDLDGDGKTGGIEKVERKTAASDIIPITQKSELGDSLGIAFSDKFDPIEKVSDIDQLASIHDVQAPYLTIWESLCKNNYLSPRHQSISRQVKRNSNSIMTKNMGIGRRNIENMVVGKREHDRMASDKVQTFAVGDVKK